MVFSVVACSILTVERGLYCGWEVAKRILDNKEPSVPVQTLIDPDRAELDAQISRYTQSRSPSPVSYLNYKRVSWIFDDPIVLHAGNTVLYALFAANVIPMGASIGVFVYLFYTFAYFGKENQYWSSKALLLLVSSSLQELHVRTKWLVDNTPSYTSWATTAAQIVVAIAIMKFTGRPPIP